MPSVAIHVADHVSRSVHVAICLRTAGCDKHVGEVQYKQRMINCILRTVRHQRVLNNANSCTACTVHACIRNRPSAAADHIAPSLIPIMKEGIQAFTNNDQIIPNYGNVYLPSCQIRALRCKAAVVGGNKSCGVRAVRSMNGRRYLAWWSTARLLKSLKCPEGS